MKSNDRPDLQRVLEAKAALTDDARADKLKRKRAKGGWTARQAVAALSDAGTFVEYGGLVQPGSKDMEGAADGLVSGTAMLEGSPIDIAAYDYSVYGGSQSAMNHRKLSRIVKHAAAARVPLVLWLEGGGGRPQDMLLAARGASTSLVEFARLSGLVPTVGIVPGPAFAGHANLAGMSDLVIATSKATIGLAGPPLVQAALGVKLTPEEIGPVETHVASGLIDVLVEDEAAAVDSARKYLAYFRPFAGPADAANQASLRELVPDNPRRAYDVRKVINILCDTGSVFEIRGLWGRSIVTCLARMGGRAIGVVANQPSVRAGAIDAEAARKAARFVQLCDAYDIPLLMLCDTPGVMVGPDAEKTGLVRESARLLGALSNATTLIMSVVLRKAYGLGHYIMGSLALEPRVIVAWPGAEFGGMGLEGAVNIIHRKRLNSIEAKEERLAVHAELTAALKSANTALEIAQRFLVDDVIDPADTRAVLCTTLATWNPQPRGGRKRTIDGY